MLVIACNTASAAMLRDARERYDGASGIPVVEVIQPAVRAAVRATRNGRVGVIGTAGTIQSRAYDDAFAAASGLELFTRACPRFVEFVEAGVTSGDELFAVAEEYLAPAARRRHRHPRARLHALPADVGRDPVRDGSGCPARLERGGDGRGRLPHPRLARPRAAARPRRRSISSSRPATTRRAFRASRTASSGPRCATSRRSRPEPSPSKGPLHDRP